MSIDEDSRFVVTADDAVRLAQMVRLTLTEGDEEAVAAGLTAHLAATASLLDELPAETSPSLGFDPRW